MSSSWDGGERRDTTDHDTLTNVVAILRIHVDNFDKHVEEDKKQFAVINRNMYIAIGVVMAIEFVSRFTGR